MSKTERNATWLKTMKRDHPDYPVCPRCGHFIPNDETPGKYIGALSRRDNATYICSNCGTLEGLEDWTQDPRLRYTGEPYWTPTGLSKRELQIERYGFEPDYGRRD